MDLHLLEQDFIMIRPYHPTDSDAVLDLWLKASILAHDFVPESFWREQLPAMRELYLPQAETLVLEEKGQVLGFASLHEQRLAALFVSPDAQGRGLGRRLLDDAKRRRDSLELGVYRANARAVAFYRAGGFVTLNETRDPHTGQPELTMRWSRG
ncbi:N-acetyltransferase [Ectopseudomonas guguanensis]|jgi:putative acetyltransferase|uniref:N-acetyltransferase n=1 Tax=Ectopseudomonas guguanensis TaxID=1198456 RepID=UPI0012D54CA9|nr:MULTISPECIES: N-acetyltransferase [Pseudomonas]MPT17680.1 N-acetyltransferase [Pseudomonas sp.]WJH59055.1 N-acetyltransferase [Pseudomonas guguanensis]